MFSISRRQLKAAALSALLAASASEAAALTISYDFTANKEGNETAETPDYALKGDFRLVDDSFDFSPRYPSRGGAPTERWKASFEAAEGARLVYDGQELDLSEFEISGLSNSLKNFYRPPSEITLDFAKTEVEGNITRITTYSFWFRVNTEEPVYLGDLDSEAALTALNSDEITKRYSDNTFRGFFADRETRTYDSSSGLTFISEEKLLTMNDGSNLVRSHSVSLKVDAPVSAVPLPATALLLPVALGALGFAGKRRRKAA